MRKLRTNLVVVILLVLLVPTTLIGVFTVERISDAVLELAQVKRLQLASEARDEALELFTDLRNNFLFLSQAPGTRVFAEAEETGTPPEEAIAKYVDFLSLFLKDSHYTDINVLDIEGQEIIHLVNENNTVRDLGEHPYQEERFRQYFNQTINLSPGGLYISALEVDLVETAAGLEYRPTLVYAVPLFSKSGNKIGILIARGGVTHILDAVKAVSAQEETLVLDANDGSYVLHPDDSKRFGALLGTGESLYVDAVNDAGPILAQRKEQGTLFASEDNPHLFQAFVSLSPLEHESIDWVLLYRLPLSQIFEPVNQARWFIFFLTLVAVAGAFAVALFVTKSITDPVQGLAQAAQALSRGEWQTDLPLGRPGKLMYSQELMGLTKAFAQMREGLKESRAALEEYNVKLEQTVKERTAELNKKMMELERINKVMVGREVKMAELKKRVKQLEDQLGLPRKG